MKTKIFLLTAGILLIVSVTIGGTLVFSSEETLKTLEEKNAIACPAREDNEYYQIGETAFQNKDNFLDKIVQNFSEKQDKLFDEYISEFSGASLTCGLPALGKSAMDKKKALETFVAERLADLRQVDCALTDLLQSGRLFCAQENMDRASVSFCEAELEEENKRISEDLQKTMGTLLEELDDIIIAYPLHKQLECVHEGLLTQRETLIKILRLHAAIDTAFLNAATSK